MAFYFLMFWLPAIASLLLIVRLWSEGELASRAAVMFGCWFLLSLGAQYFARHPGVWIAGLVSQTGLAIVLILKRRIPFD